MSTIRRLRASRLAIAVGLAAAVAIPVATLSTPAHAAVKKVVVKKVVVKKYGGPVVASVAKCGLGNGKKATGAPVKVGAVMTNVPGIEFQDGPNTQKAYFDCVNDNGGINGRPIQLIVENDEVDPAKASAAAAKLIESDKVVAMAGGFSIVDCPVNAKYYASKGFNVLVAGVPAECFGSPNIAAVNMGPHYSAQGAAEYVIRAGAKGKIVHVTGKVPGAEYNGSSIKTLAAAKGLQFEDVQVELPIKDGASLALDLTKRAGKGGGVVITAVPSQTLAIMKGAEDQGVINDVVWGSATPANDISVAKALTSAWDGKIGINAELALLDSTGPDMTLYRAVMAKYGGKTPIGSFGQMGFLLGKIVVDALMTLDPKNITPITANAAIQSVVNYKNDILCKPWYFANLPSHVPNNWDRTVTPSGGKFLQKEDCFAITAYDDVLTAVRKAEATQSLNKG